MSRTLTFLLISTHRLDGTGPPLGGGSKANLIRMKEQVLARLDQLPAVSAEAGHIREYHWHRDELANFEKATQWRVRLWINKGRATTWNQIYNTVNEVYAPHYKFL